MASRHTPISDFPIEKYETEVKQLLKEAIEKLYRAVQELDEGLPIHIPKPRPRTFEFAPGVTWPRDDNLYYMRVRSGAGVYITNDWRIVDEVYKACGGQPRKVYRALRRIRAAIEWCRARRAGKKRMMEEIIRQQGYYFSELYKEVVVKALQK